MAIKRPQTFNFIHELVHHAETACPEARAMLARFAGERRPGTGGKPACGLCAAMQSGDMAVGKPAKKRRLSIEDMKAKSRRL